VASDLDRFDDGIEWNPENLTTGLYGHDTGHHDSEREREPRGGALPWAAFDGDPSPEPLHGRPNRVHSDTAPGQPGNRCRGREARGENKLDHLPVVEGGDVLCRTDTPRCGDFPDPLHVNATPVILYFDDDMLALSGGAKVDCRWLPLPLGCPFGGTLDPMV
jgi:hypothetical protein